MNDVAGALDSAQGLLKIAHWGTDNRIK